MKRRRLKERAAAAAVCLIFSTVFSMGITAAEAESAEAGGAEAHGGSESESEGVADAERVYGGYIRDKLLPELGFADLTTDTGYVLEETAASQRGWSLRSGLLGADVVDLDGDGSEEMLLYYFGSRENGNGSGVSGADRGVYVDLYRLENGEAEPIGTQTLCYSDDVTFVTVSAGLMEVGDVPCLYLEEAWSDYFSDNGAVVYRWFAYENGELTLADEIAPSGNGEDGIAYSLLTRQPDGNYGTAVLWAEEPYREQHRDAFVYTAPGTSLEEAVELGFEILGLPAPGEGPSGYLWEAMPTFRGEACLQQSFLYDAIGGEELENGGREMTVTVEDCTGLRERIADLGEEETERESETEMESESESETEAQTEFESETEIEAESETETEIEIESELALEIEIESETESELASEREVEPQTESERETETELESLTAVHVQLPARQFYTSAQGHGGPVELSVAVGLDGTLLDISVAECSGEDTGAQAAEELAARILAAQSTDVDTISGATETCDAVRCSVEAVLQLLEAEETARAEQTAQEMPEAEADFPITRQESFWPETFKEQAGAADQAQTEAAQPEAPQPAQPQTEFPVVREDSYSMEITDVVVGDTSFYVDGTPVAQNQYILPESSSRYLTSGDLSRLTMKGVSYAKNEIYAKHGRKFVAPELQQYFGKQSWYHGTIEAADFTETEVNALFNEYEKANVRFFSDWEAAHGEYQY